MSRFVVQLHDATRLHFDLRLLAITIAQANGSARQ
jgi:hypothetical protein